MNKVRKVCLLTLEFRKTEAHWRGRGVRGAALGVRGAPRAGRWRAAAQRSLIRRPDAPYWYTGTRTCKELIAPSAHVRDTSTVTRDMGEADKRK